jgi:hypothetical protein
MSDSGRQGFLSRWSQRKIQARENRLVRDEDQATDRTVAPQAGQPAAETRPIVDGPGREWPSREWPGHDKAAATPSADAGTGDISTASRPDVAPAQAGQAREKALPSLEDVRLLTPESDFSPFVARGVAPAVKNAAMKKLFADPHFNVMDGLDIYIDDYTQREILPEAMMRKMASSKFLRMFTDEEDAEASTAAQRAAGSGQEVDGQAESPDGDYLQDETANVGPVPAGMVSSPPEARAEASGAGPFRMQTSETESPDTGTPSMALRGEGTSEFSGVVVPDAIPTREAGTQTVAALGVYPGLPPVVPQVQNRPEASRTSITKSEQQPGDAPSDTEP